MSFGLACLTQLAVSHNDRPLIFTSHTENEKLYTLGTLTSVTVIVLACLDRSLSPGRYLVQNIYKLDSNTGKKGESLFRIVQLLHNDRRQTKGRISSDVY